MNAIFETRETAYTVADLHMLLGDMPLSRVFIAPEQSVELKDYETLDGGAVLPGFSLVLADFFAKPK